MSMLSGLRDPTGGPSLRIRALSLVVVLGLVLLTAPLVLLPLLRWLVGVVSP